MNVNDIKEFLEFRKKFSKREWHEINEAVRLQENKRADQIVLDDSDLKQILVRIFDNKFLDIDAENRIQIAEDIVKDLGVFGDDQ